MNKNKNKTLFMDVTDELETAPVRKADIGLVVDINEVRDQKDIRIQIIANENECKTLAKTLNILKVNNFNADIALRLGVRSDLYEIEGRIIANVTQECGVTFAPVDEAIEDVFSEILTTSAQALEEADPEDEGENTPVDLIEGGKIPVGTIVTQWLALALDPFPRVDHVPTFQHIEAAEGTSPDTHRPFAALEGINLKAPKDKGK